MAFLQGLGLLSRRAWLLEEGEPGGRYPGARGPNCRRERSGMRVRTERLPHRPGLLQRHGEV